MTQPMCLKSCLDSYLSAKATSMSIRYLDQNLEAQTYANGNFLDLIPSQEHIWKAQIVNIATPSTLSNTFTLRSAREKSKRRMKKWFALSIPPSLDL